jgi:metal-sulfur cluster biosynthetic enzyme
MLKEKVIEALRQVYDPEMPTTSIYDLGLIYELEVSEDGDVDIKHTLTSMFCPFADEICQSIEVAAGSVEGIKKVKRELVFDPPFSIEMVPEETRMVMGF